jgi:hypothetical protein
VPSRRQLLQSGLATSVAALLPLHAAVTTRHGSEAARPQPELFVFDERFPAAIAAGREALRRDVRLTSTRELFTSLWYEELDLRWRQSPMIVAGVTTERSLYVLETLALDRRMRIIHRTPIGRDDLVSWMIGPTPRSLVKPAFPGA